MATSANTTGKIFSLQKETCNGSGLFCSFSLKKCSELRKKNEKYLGQARCQAQI
jgi:hypothetical protein